MTRNQYIIVGVLILLAAAAGRYLTPEKIVTKTITVEVEKKQEKTIKERVKAVLEESQTVSQLSSWERHTFLPSTSRFSILSQKQQAILDKIELRIELSEEPYDEDSYNS